MVEIVTPMFFQSEDGVLVRVIDGSNQHPVYERYDAQEGLFVEDFEFVYAITQGRDPEDDFEYQEHELLSEGEFNKRLAVEQRDRAKRMGIPFVEPPETVIRERNVNLDPLNFDDSEELEKHPDVDFDGAEKTAAEAVDQLTDEELYDGLPDYLKPDKPKK